jgi:hypothetical protein
MKESEKILDIVRSVLVIQNRQSIPLCISRIDDYFTRKAEYDVLISNKKNETPVEIMLNQLNKKCVHPYYDVEQNDMGQIVCKTCKEILAD